MSAQVGDLLLAAQTLLADQRDHLDLRSDDVEHHVEAHLVVTGSGAAVAKVVGADFAGVFGNGRRLRDPLGADRNRISSVFQHIPEDHVLDRMLVIILRHVERHVALYAEIVSSLFNRGKFLGRKSAGVRQGGVHFQSHLFRKVNRTVRGIQSSAESQYYFFHRCLIALFQ